MDKIKLKDLAFYAYHGVLAEEKKIGQKFIIDVEILADLRKAGISDEVSDTINYAQVYGIIENIVVNKRFNLLEALAESIANSILDKYPMIKEVNIGIKKPEAPIKGIYDYVGVEIRRSNNG